MPTLGNYNEESICDFNVTAERKQIWASLLDLLSAIDDICKKHDITYYAIGGTLLGAVRHKGFIPWDDDLDIAMMREDYNRFLQIAEKELSGKYFLQTTLTDSNYYKEHARIRNSETTGICEHYEFNGCNNGIYLDILPLEKFSNSFSGRLHSNICRTLGQILTVKVHYKYKGKHTTRSKIAYILGIPINLKSGHNYREKLETKNWDKRTDKVTLGDVRYSAYTRERLTFNIDDFKAVVELPFENGVIPAPIGYHQVLKQEYGDYMQFPPVEKRGLHHGIIFDPYTPYPEYIMEHYAELAELKYHKK